MAEAVPLGRFGSFSGSHSRRESGPLLADHDAVGGLGISIAFRRGHVRNSAWIYRSPALPPHGSLVGPLYPRWLTPPWLEAEDRELGFRRPDPGRREVLGGVLLLALLAHVELM